jgi:hypothetical protein
MTMTTKELDIATLDHGDIEFRASPWANSVPKHFNGFGGS